MIRWVLGLVLRLKFGVNQSEFPRQDYGVISRERV